MTNRKTIIGVLGDGSWGTALALHLYKNGHQVRLWSAFADHAEALRNERENKRFLPGFSIPKDLVVTADFEALSPGCDFFLSVVPTVYLRSVLQKFEPFYKQGTPVVSATKGIEIGTLRLPDEMIHEVLGKECPVVVLAGPSHAEEVAQSLPASLVAASESTELSQKVQEVFSGETFRIYTSDDPRGVEIGGALKNILAIAAGISDGLALGDNAKAALITRGIVEMARYGASAGAKKETFFGLTGIGDLLTTCYSRHSRNRAVGERIGQGEKLDDILASSAMVAEGVTTTRAICENKQAVEMPITEEVYEVLFKGKEPRQALLDLMNRAPRAESEK